MRNSKQINILKELANQLNKLRIDDDIKGRPPHSYSDVIRELLKIREEYEELKEEYKWLSIIKDQLLKRRDWHTEEKRRKDNGNSK